MLHDKGEIDKAITYINLALPANYAVDDPRSIAYCLVLASRINLELRQLNVAEKQVEESLAIGQATNDPYLVNMSYAVMGLIKRAQKDYVTARQLLNKAIELFALSNDWVGVERIAVNLGVLEIEVGDLAAAKAPFLDMLQVSEREHSPRYMLTSVMSLADIKNREGDPFIALVWLLFVLRHPMLDRRTQSYTERLQREVENQLTAEQIAAAQTQSAKLTLDSIIAAFNT
jgi:tetratricopeptide (TPR) repeat protein